MTTRFQCPNCGARLTYSGQSGSKTRPCPKCQTPIAFVAVAPSPAPCETMAATRNASGSVDETILDAEIIENEPFKEAPQPAAPPPAGKPLTQTPPKRRKRRWLLAMGIGGGGMLACVLLCAGIGILASASRSGSSGGGEGDSKSETAYSSSGSYPSDPYASTNYTPTPDPSATTGYTPAPYDPYATSESSYAPSSTTQYAPSQDYSATTYSQAPSIETSGYDSTAASPQLWNFDRATELRNAIAQDQARLKDLDVLIFGADAGSITGEAAAGNEQSRLDQLLGPWLRRGSEAAKRRLQTERDEVQIRLNANLAELTRLEQGY